MEITFEHPIYLLFLVLIPLLAAIHFYSLHYVRQKAMRFANFEALEKIVQTRSIVPKNYLLLAMRILTLVGFTLAAAGMIAHYQTPASAYDYVVAFDTSNSMLAGDFSPTRIEVAKSSVENWITSLPAGSHVGILTFSSQASLLLEPTGDLANAALKTREITPDKSGGTAICEALKAGTNWLSGSFNPKAIVMVSDGQNNAGCLLDEGIDYAKENGVTVFAVGVGSQAGGRIAGVSDVVFKLDEADLRRAATNTGGQYFRAKSPSEMSEVFDQLKHPGMRKVTLPLAIPLMMFSFLFVFIDWGLSITRYRTIP